MCFVSPFPIQQSVMDVAEQLEREISSLKKQNEELMKDQKETEKMLSGQIER